MSSGEDFYMAIGEPYKFKCWECLGKGRHPDSISEIEGKLIIHYQLCLRCQGTKVSFYQNYAYLKDGKIYRVGLWSDGTPSFDVKWNVS